MGDQKAEAALMVSSNGHRIICKTVSLHNGKKNLDTPTFRTMISVAYSFSFQSAAE